MSVEGFGLVALYLLVLVARHAPVRAYPNRTGVILIRQARNDEGQAVAFVEMGKDALPEPHELLLLGEEPEVALGIVCQMLDAVAG